MALKDLPPRYAWAQVALTLHRYARGQLRACHFHGLDNVRIDGPKRTSNGTRYYLTCRSCETAVKRHRRRNS